MDPTFSVHPLSDTPAEGVFDTLTRLASQLLGVPVALISLVEPDRQFFKSQVGLGEPYASLRQTPLSHSFCKHVVQMGEPLLVEDARTDPRVRENLAIPELGVIAYLGVPLLDDDGAAYGALCAINGEARAWAERDVEVLQTLAAQAMRELNLRSQVANQNKKLESLQHAKQRVTSLIRANMHDLRTPLNALLLGLQGVRLFGDLNEDQAHSMDIAERSCSNLSSMIDQMLESGIVSGEGVMTLIRSNESPSALAAASIDNVLPLAKAKQLELAGPLGHGSSIYVDKGKIERVLVNLLGNAIKYTPEGGSISLTISDEMDGDASFVTFAVRDNGIGMAEGDVQSLFIEGFRVDQMAPASVSTGIGLSYCRKVVEAHGGKIGVESVLGAGSTFRVSLPRHGKEARNAQNG